MKKSLLLAGLLLTTSGAFAAESTDAGKWFVGLDVAKYSNSMSGTARYNGITYQASTSDSDTAPNFKLGLETKENRMYASYSVLYDKDNVSYESLDFNYDKFADEINGVKPYYGVHAGIGWLAINGFENSGIEYGFQGGLLKQIDDKSSFELGAKYRIATASLNATAGSNYARVDADKSTAVFVGFNTKF